MEKDTIITDLSTAEIVDVESIFLSTIKFAKWIALYRHQYKEGSDGRTRLKICSWMKFIIIHASLWFIPIRVGLVLYREQNNAGRLIPIFAVFGLHFGTAYISTTTFFTLSKNYVLLCKSIKRHQHDYGPLKRPYLLRQINKWGTGLSVSLSVLDAAIYCFMLPSIRGSGLTDFMYPFHFNDTWNTVLTLSVLFTGELIVLLHMFNLLLIFTAMSFLFITEFSRINTNIQKTINNMLTTQKPDDHAIEHLRQEHASLLGCLEYSNSMVSHYLFGFYATNIPVICFVIYGVIRGVLTNTEEMLVCFLAGTNFTSVAVYTVIGSVVSLKAHGAVNDLMKVNLHSATEKTYQSVSMFVSRLSGPKLGYRVYELFTVDPSTILALTGTLVTYAVVMLQFSGSPIRILRDSVNVTCEI